MKSLGIHILRIIMISIVLLFVEGVVVGSTMAWSGSLPAAWQMLLGIPIFILSAPQFLLVAFHVPTRFGVLYLAFPGLFWALIVYGGFMLYRSKKSRIPQNGA